MLLLLPRVCLLFLRPALIGPILVGIRCCMGLWCGEMRGGTGGGGVGEEGKGQEWGGRGWEEGGEVVVMVFRILQKTS